MPPLLPLATRYTVWLVVLTILSGVAINYAGFPNTLATGVILAAAPAADIGYQAAKRATRALGLRDWAKVWGVCFGVFAGLRLVVPVLVFPPVREGLSQPGMLNTMGLVVLSTAVMMVIFIWIGDRSAGGSAKG